MSLKNAKLMVSALGNEIYLGTLKKNSKFPVMNENRVLFTQEAIRAVAEHMMGMKDGDCYEFPGRGRLMWVADKSQPIESSEDGA